ncbi:MAG: DNRLRE domain-containing protein [Planctomycetes bacterium]|nr:DNRLRE domain-containing protein [Planctomycetota bacterium]
MSLGGRVGLATLLFIVATVRADQLNLQPSKDNTLYESATGALSNGAGENLFSGKTGQPTGSLRRALLQFDVSSIPAGSYVQGVTLTMHCSLSSGGTQVMSLHRVTADWGESTSIAAPPGGLGAPAAPGDATWLHTFSPSDFWATPGGDFAAASSASAIVAAADAYYVWGPTASLVADVQSWVDGAAMNHGWIMLGNESLSNSAKRFESRESIDSSQRPSLTVTYLPPLPGDADCSGSVTDADVLPLVGALLGQYSGCDERRADTNSDGFLNGRDISAFLTILMP